MRRPLCQILIVLMLGSLARADGLLFSYDGDVLPDSPEGGFPISRSRPCEVDCSVRLEDGHFVLEWGPHGEWVGYGHRIAEPPNPPPDTLWVEWQFRSNQPIPATSTNCDGSMTIDYKGALDDAFMFQDAVVDFEGGDFVLGLQPDVFHTYRFESLEGTDYTMSVDGFVFNTDYSPDGDQYHDIQFEGKGACSAVGPDRPVPVRNEWDFIRYGTIGSGEQMASVDPVPGNLTASEGAQFRSFVITFDQPAYLYIDDITVTTTGGTPPTITATRRPDNGAPEVLEVFIDGTLPLDQTTTFTFDTGTRPQSVSYFRERPEIPATSVWGLVLLTLAALIIGAATFRRTRCMPT